MRYITIATLAASASLITACGGVDSNDGIPDPGMYREQITVTKVDFPDITEEERKTVITQMERGMGNGEVCLTKENNTAWQDVMQDMSKGLGGTCTQNAAEQTDSTLKLEAVCKGTPKGDITIKMDAASTDTGYKGNMSMDFDHVKSGQKGHVSYVLEGTRIGDCGG